LVDPPVDPKVFWYSERIVVCPPTCVAMGGNGLCMPFRSSCSSWSLEAAVMAGDEKWAPLLSNPPPHSDAGGNLLGIVVTRSRK